MRERIVAAVDDNNGTIAQIAELFQVTERFIYELLAQRRQTSDLAPLPHGGGAKAKLGPQQLLQLAELVAEFPDATIDELRPLLQRRARVKVGVSTVWRALSTVRSKYAACFNGHVTSGYVGAHSSFMFSDTVSRPAGYLLRTLLGVIDLTVKKDLSPPRGKPARARVVPA